MSSSSGNTRSRKIVLENLHVAANPIAPADWTLPFDPVPDDPEGRSAVVSPGISARLILPLLEGRMLVRPDKVYDVHYHLLNLASLSEYEETRVYYTAAGLMREMNWKEGGRQTKLVRDCVDYLWKTIFEFEGVLPDPIVEGRFSYQTHAFRILISRGFPYLEDRKSGGRNTSFIDYNPQYLATIRNNPAVQLDVELMALIPGILGKAFYRTASWLRAVGEDRISLPDLFERVGSLRQRTLPSDAIRVFESAWGMMQRYNYLRSAPRFEKRETGSYDLIFDWGEPVSIPSRSDALFFSLTEAGVNTRTAERMLREDRKRTLKVVQAFKAGALGKPNTTPAALIVGAYGKEDWSFEEYFEHEDQHDLLSTPASPIEQKLEQEKVQVRSRPAADSS